MKLNYETCLVGSSSILVPYRQEHVQKYHDWMLNPKLLEATASEPLSLQEEYENQESWRDDPEKCTFIVLAKEACSENDVTVAENEKFVKDNLHAMTGDVNLFLSDEDEETDDDGSDQEKEQPSRHNAEDIIPRRQAEVDIMIVETAYRRNGLGTEAVCLMMMYGATHLNITRFFCKIHEDNTASLTLFRKLGFQQCAYAACFQEIELEIKRESSDEMVKAISTLLGNDTIQSFQCPIKPNGSPNHDSGADSR
jgi:RimJ/RimL family protein N-acetyltransferase